MKLLKNDDIIIRVLMEQFEKSLIIDCIKRTMPKWVLSASLADFGECAESELYERTGIPQNRELTEEDKRIAQEHYSMIAGVLPFIGNEQKRSQMIELLSENQSKQTIRKYLCLYLVYQDIAALAPSPRVEKELTQDEKNIRWALNKFFYTKNKNSLNTAYTMMLKAKYCTPDGQLVEQYPSFYQFRYFYRKTKSMQKYYISRDGIKDYQRNNRPLLGDGVQQFAPAVGTGMLVTDMGSEYKGDTFSQIAELGVKIVNQSPYRPELKSSIERFFGLIQDEYKKHLKGKGVIEPDFQERGAHDYRKDACLTLKQFEQIILHCIIYYNNHRIIDFPFTEAMIAAEVKPYASSIFHWGRKQLGANLMDVDAKKLIQVLLPRAKGKFTRKGLVVNGLRYRHDDYTEAFLQGGEAVVAYNPENVTEVWLIEKGSFIPFALIESRFAGKTLEAAQTMQKTRKNTVAAANADSLQAQINLAEHIQVIAAQGKHTDVGLKNIRSTRKKEQTRTHRDYVKESHING